MSLISDALRKARHDATASGHPPPAGVRGTASTPPRSGLASVLLAGALVGAALVVAGGATVWWILAPDREAPRPADRPPTGSSAAPATSEQSTPAPQPTEHTTARLIDDSTAGPPVGIVEKSAVPEAEKPAPPPPVDPVPRPDHPPAVPGDPGQTVPSTRPAAGPSSAPTAQPGPAAEAGTTEPRTFVLDAELDDVSLHLGYLVYDPGSSFAEINGDQVVEGSVVASFVVESILPDRVVLRRDDQTVVLLTR